MLENRRLEILSDKAGRGRGNVQRAGPVGIDPRLRLGESRRRRRRHTSGRSPGIPSARRPPRSWRPCAPTARAPRPSCCCWSPARRPDPGFRRRRRRSSPRPAAAPSHRCPQGRAADESPPRHAGSTARARRSPPGAPRRSAGPSASSRRWIRRTPQSRRSAFARRSTTSSRGMLWLSEAFASSVTRAELTTRTASNPDAVCASNPTGPTTPRASTTASSRVPPRRIRVPRLAGRPVRGPGV